MKCCTADDECLDPDGPILPLDQFHKSKTGRWGLQYKCKTCMKKDAERRRHWLFTEATLDEFLLEKFTDSKRSAEKKQLPFGFTPESWLESYYATGGRCRVTRKKFSREWTEWDINGSHYPYAPSPDRIIPPLGYVRDNVQWITVQANLSRNTCPVHAWYGLSFGVVRTTGDLGLLFEKVLKDGRYTKRELHELIDRADAPGEAALGRPAGALADWWFTRGGEPAGDHPGFVRGFE